MKTPYPIALVASIVLLVAWPAFGQVLLEGTWDLQASGVLPSEVDPCVYEGSSEIVQSGDQLTGQPALMLVSGPASCPVDVMADFMGTVEGSSVFGTLDGGQMFGLLNLQGTVSGDGQSIEGSFIVEEGPFAGTTGTWSAALQGQVSVLEIPTMEAWGLALLATLLALTSLLVLRRTWG